MLSRLVNLRKLGSVAFDRNAYFFSCSWMLKDERSGNLKNVSDEEWAKRLTPEAFEVCRKAGTERPFTGKYNSFYASGIFTCVCCGSKLFSSDSKFNSGSGWPSFHSAIPEALEERRDMSHGMIRQEVKCAKCEAHLGHVFDDGPPPSGLRFCINSVCLNFVPDADKLN